MEIYLAEKLKSLRAEKNISQEKLAQYLNVSFQAVSKWENGNSYPDISLLPEIARFFDITVDELLQVEKIDEQKLYAEYRERACKLYRNGDIPASLSVWQEAYHFMPNNTDVKEMLMSAYFDVDKVKYRKEIIELGTELYNKSLTADAGEKEIYCRGQAISQLAKVYSVNGETESAEKWASKASFLMHSQEFIYTEITSGKDLLTYFRYANYWYFKNLFYMACRITDDPELSKNEYGRDVFTTLTNLYEVVYPDGDMEFELLDVMCILHRCIAEYEISGDNREEAVFESLKKALIYAEKSVNVTAHKMTHPLFLGMEIYDAPSDNKQIVRNLNNELNSESFKKYQNADWFIEITGRLRVLLDTAE